MGRDDEVQAVRDMWFAVRDAESELHALSRDVQDASIRVEHTILFLEPPEDAVDARHKIADELKTAAAAFQRELHSALEAVSAGIGRFRTLADDIEAKSR